MKKSTLIVLILLFSFLQGCAASYQPRGETGEGFTETQLDKNVFRVSFSGNRYTDSERASDLALLRSAELTLLHGYTYFIVADNSDVIDVRGERSRPSSTNVIVCFDEKPDNATFSYNAEFVYKQLSAKYEIQ